MARVLKLAKVMEKAKKMRLRMDMAKEMLRERGKAKALAKGTNLVLVSELRLLYSKLIFFQT